MLTLQLLQQPVVGFVDNPAVERCTVHCDNGVGTYFAVPKQNFGFLGVECKVAQDCKKVLVGTYNASDWERFDALVFEIVVGLE